MLKNEYKKMLLLIDRLEKLIYPLKGKKYDFTRFFASDNMFDEFLLKLDNFEDEKNKQDKMKDIVKNVINFDIKGYYERLINDKKIDQNFDEYFENIIRIEDYDNYYVLSLYGISSFYVNFIFNKNGELLLDNKNICVIDSENIFVFDYDIKKMKEELYHYQISDLKVNLVNVIDNVIDVDYCDFFNRDLVICCCGEDRMLYNYKTKKILIPSYSCMYSDVGNFAEYVQNSDKYIRIVKKLYGIDDYKSSLIGNLEFLVDRNGKISSFVCDFESGYSCSNSLLYFKNTQEEILNNVYKDASKMSKLYKRVKKQN